MQVSLPSYIILDFLLTLEVSFVQSVRYGRIPTKEEIAEVQSNGSKALYKKLDAEMVAAEAVNRLSHENHACSIFAFCL